MQKGTLEKDLTQGNVAIQLIKFALPFILSNLIQTLYNVADMLIVGNYCGPEGIAGVNIGGQVTFIMTNTSAPATGRGCVNPSGRCSLSCWLRQ